MDKGNVEVAPEIYAPHFVSHQHSHPHVRDVRGLSALIAFVREFREAFPDFHDSIDDQIAEGDKVVTRFASTGTHRGVGQLGSVRDDATVGRDVVTSGLLWKGDKHAINSAAVRTGRIAPFSVAPTPHNPSFR